MDPDMEQQLHDVLEGPSHTEMDDTSLPVAHSPQPDGSQEQLHQSVGPLDEEKLGHMCIVLSPQIRKQLMQGEPLIVGTSTASVEAFFQRLISVCQQGAHMPVMFQTLSGAVTVANIKKRKNGIIAKSRTERYPLPQTSSSGTRRNRTPASAAESVPSTSQRSTASVEEASTQEKSKKASERDEIPLEAIRLYLTEKQYFPGWNANAKRNLRKRCKDFILDEKGIICYQTKKGTSLPCVEDKAERMNIIWEAHVMDHRRRDGLLNGLREKYYWKGMFQDVNKVLDSCQVCSNQKAQKNKEREEHEGTLEQDEYETPLTPKAKRVRTRKSAEYVDKPSTPEPGDLEKYPETSEVVLGDRSTD